jgi:hypothetical protein
MESKMELISLLRKRFVQDRMSMIYHGIFDDSFTSQFISLAENDVEKKTKKRVSLLISECFQNIIRHGHNPTDGSEKSVFGIRGIDQFIYIFSHNSVDQATKDFLEQKLLEISQMDLDQINNQYRRSLEGGQLSGKGGAGLGLIEMARKSKRPIQNKFITARKGLYTFSMQISLPTESNESIMVAVPLVSLEENEQLRQLIVENEILFMYKGEFSPEIVTPILSIMTPNAEGSGSRDSFNILHVAVELIQNIVRHGKVIDGKKEGIFSLQKTKNGYYLCTGNHIKEEAPELLIGAIQELNSKTVVELNEDYKSLLKANLFDQKDSAGVGLIDLRRTMMTPIDILTTEDSNGTFVMIGIEIPIQL